MFTQGIPRLRIEPRSMGQEGGGGYTNHYYTTQHTTYKGETHIETLIQGINLNDERTIAGKERKEGRWKMVKEEVNGKTKQSALAGIEPSISGWCTGTLTTIPPGIS